MGVTVGPCFLFHTVFFNLVFTSKSVLTGTPLVVLARLPNVWEAISMNVPSTLVVKG